MTKTLRLYGGPRDGEGFELPEDMTAKAGETFMIEGARYRVAADEVFADFDPPNGVGYRFNPDTGGVDAQPVEAGTRLTATELLLAAMTGATVGLMTALGFVVVAWVTGWLHALAGGYVNLLLWTAGGSAVALVIAVAFRPAIVREKE